MANNIMINHETGHWENPHKADNVLQICFALASNRKPTCAMKAFRGIKCQQGLFMRYMCIMPL